VNLDTPGAFLYNRHQIRDRIISMEPTSHGTDDNFPQLWSDGDSEPWTPREILADTSAPQNGPSPVPFVVQSGRMLLIVEATSEGWTLAELDFITGHCLFRESRRATYTWPREAFGAMLSRLAAAEPDEATLARLTQEFSQWIGDRFARVRCHGQICC
jgi:hypothetical protein